MGAANLGAFHEGSTLVLSCECQRVDYPFVWRLNSAVINGSSDNVTISSKLSESVITVNSISKQQEGTLCCSRHLSAACSQFQVVSPPNVTISLLNEPGCRAEAIVNHTVALAAVTCAVSSYLEGDITQGFMQLYLNNDPTIAIDSHPTESNETDQLTRKMWKKRYNFSQQVPKGMSSIFVCRWIQEDGNVYISEFKLTLGTCPTHVPTTTTTTTTTTTRDRDSNTSSSETHEVVIPVVIVVFILILVLVGVLQFKYRIFAYLRCNIPPQGEPRGSNEANTPGWFMYTFMRACVRMCVCVCVCVCCTVTILT